jgi:hypothetical protein
VGALTGCGSKQPTHAELKLEREDLAAFAGALRSVEPMVMRELQATKRAWPFVVNGLPSGPLTALRAPVAAAAQSAANIKTPALLREKADSSLTGPAASLAGLFRTYIGLATRGWQLTSVAIDQIEAGAARSAPRNTALVARALAGARFARENVGLYIESVYDAHFELAQIEKKLRVGYKKLGGAAAFGSSLTPAEVNAIADAYSEPTARLHPHVGIRLGS